MNVETRNIRGRTLVEPMVKMETSTKTQTESQTIETPMEMESLVETTEEGGEGTGKMRESFNSQFKSQMSLQTQPSLPANSGAARQIAAHQLANEAMQAEMRAKKMEAFAAAVRRGEQVSLDILQFGATQVAAPNNSKLIDNELKNGQFYQAPEVFIQKKMSEFEAAATGYSAGAPVNDGPSQTGRDPINTGGRAHFDLSALGNRNVPHQTATARADVEFGLSSIDEAIGDMIERHQAEQMLMQIHHQQQMQQLQKLRMTKLEEERALKYQRQQEVEERFAKQYEEGGRGGEDGRPQKKVKLSHEEMMLERRMQHQAVEMREAAAAEAEMLAMGIEMPPDDDIVPTINTMNTNTNTNSPKHASRPGSNGDNLFTGFDEHGMEYVLGHPIQAWDDFFDMSETGGF